MAGTKRPKKDNKQTTKKVNVDPAAVQAVMDAVFDEDHEWWKVSSQEVFEKMAQLLLEVGMTHEAVCEVLNNLYHATASEFGN